jgi:hypothetical protein
MIFVGLCTPPFIILLSQIAAPSVDSSVARDAVEALTRGIEGLRLGLAAQGHSVVDQMAKQFAMERACLLHKVRIFDFMQAYMIDMFIST